MANLAAVLKEEIARLARKELRTEIDALRKSSSHYRSEIAALKRRLADLERQVGRLGKVTAKAGDAENAEPTEAKHRFRIGGFITLRKKLGLTADAMGKLLGVSGQSIYLWESGRTSPRASQLAVIASIRKIGKREALKRLEEMA
jgi:DNA-binding transcriptional regulator YiaG